MTKNAEHFMFARQDIMQNKMFYMIFHLKSDAVGHVQSNVAEKISQVNLKSWKKIIDVLKLAYTNADLKGTAQRTLIALYQINKQFKYFWAKFHRLAQKTGMDLATMLEYLKDCFSNKIKDRLVNINNTNMGLARFVKIM